MNVCHHTCGGTPTSVTLAERYAEVAGKRFCYRLLLHFGAERRFLIELSSSDGEVACESAGIELEAALAILQALARGAVTLCHFGDVMSDLRGA